MSKSMNTESTGSSEMTLETGVEYSIKRELQDDEKHKYSESCKLEGQMLSCLDHHSFLKIFDRISWKAIPTSQFKPFLEASLYLFI